MNIPSVNYKIIILSYLLLKNYGYGFLTVKKSEILIIGAGLTGLVLAYECMKAGVQNITLIEKGRSVGGRLATRRINETIADHGAQFFTVKSEEFNGFLKNLVPKSLLLDWPKDSSKNEEKEYQKRFAIQGGMNQLAKHVVNGLTDVNVDINTRVISISDLLSNNESEYKWLVRSEKSHIYQAKHVILTPPVPQSIELLRNGGIVVPVFEKTLLSNITYTQCLCGLFYVLGEISITFDVIENPTDNILLIADNIRKNEGNQHLLTVHTTPTFSEDNWDNPKVLSVILNEVKNYLGPFDVKIQQLKKWKYAKPLFIFEKNYHEISWGKRSLFLCGDGFGGARVEGAYISGKTTAQAIIKALNEN